MSGDINELAQARRVVREETAGWRVEAEVIRKEWPADDMLFIRLRLGDREEYVLVAPGSSENTVRKCLQTAIRRLEATDGL